MSGKKLSHEERVYVVRERLNTTHVGAAPSVPDWRTFARECIDVLDGSVEALTPYELERIKLWRRLP